MDYSVKLSNFEIKSKMSKNLKTPPMPIKQTKQLMSLSKKLNKNYSNCTLTARQKERILSEEWSTQIKLKNDSDTRSLDEYSACNSETLKLTSDNKYVNVVGPPTGFKDYEKDVDKKIELSILSNSNYSSISSQAPQLKNSRNQRDFTITV